MKARQSSNLFAYQREVFIIIPINFQFSFSTKPEQENAIKVTKHYRHANTFTNNSWWIKQPRCVVIFTRFGWRCLWPFSPHAARSIFVLIMTWKEQFANIVVDWQEYVILFLVMNSVITSQFVFVTWSVNRC